MDVWCAYERQSGGGWWVGMIDCVFGKIAVVEVYPFLLQHPEAPTR